MHGAGTEADAISTTESNVECLSVFVYVFRLSISIQRLCLSWRFVCSWRAAAFDCWFFTSMRRTRLPVVHVHWRPTWCAVKWRSIDRKLAMHNKKVCCYEVKDDDVSSMFCASTFSRILCVFDGSAHLSFDEVSTCWIRLCFCSCFVSVLWRLMTALWSGHAKMLMLGSVCFVSGPITHRSCVHRGFLWSDTDGISPHTLCAVHHLGVIYRSCKRFQWCSRFGSRRCFCVPVSWRL